MLKNKVLEKLTRTHIAVPVSIFLFYAIGLLIWTNLYTDISFYQVVSLFAAGLFLFTLVEYLMHRHLFHLFEKESPHPEWMPYKLHGLHHDYPKDKGRLAMPPIASITLATLFFFLFKAVLNDYSYATLAGFITGYAMYLIVHYVVHVYQPPKNFLKSLWINHAIHHYQDDTLMYGVSSPLWDYVFGTVPKKRARKDILVQR